MSNTKLIVAGVAAAVTLTGIITAKWLQGRSNRRAAVMSGKSILEDHPEMVVKLMRNKLQRLRDEGADADVITVTEVALATAERNLAEMHLKATQEAGEAIDQQLDQSMDRLRALNKNQPTLQ